MPASGIVLLHKPPGISSFKSLSAVKRTWGTRKVGHAGTLDPFAEGLLIALVGSFTKLNDSFMHMHKRYTAEITFGKETDTLDPEGHIIAEAPLPSQEDIEGVLHLFQGKINQTPPAFSALHVGGKRAYDLARSGKEVHLPSREIEIFFIHLVSFSKNTAVIDVCCSKGTYIRSLARDIALAAETRGYLTNLVRTEIGPFTLDHAVTPEDLKSGSDMKSGPEALSFIGDLTIFHCDRETSLLVANGVPPEELLINDTLSRTGGTALFYNNRLIALIQCINKQLSYRFVVPRADWDH